MTTPPRDEGASWATHAFPRLRYRPLAPSGPAASEGGGSEHLAACLVNRPPALSGWLRQSTPGRRLFERCTTGSRESSTLVYFFHHERAAIPPSLERDSPLAANLWNKTNGVIKTGRLPGWSGFAAGCSGGVPRVREPPGSWRFPEAATVWVWFARYTGWRPSWV